IDLLDWAVLACVALGIAVAGVAVADAAALVFLNVSGLSINAPLTGIRVVSGRSGIAGRLEVASGFAPVCSLTGSPPCAVGSSECAGADICASVIPAMRRICMGFSANFFMIVCSVIWLFGVSRWLLIARLSRQIVRPRF